MASASSQGRNSLCKDILRGTYGWHIRKYRVISVVNESLLSRLQKSLAVSSSPQLARTFSLEAWQATINSATQMFMPGLRRDLQDSASSVMASFPFWLARVFAQLAIESFKHYSWAPYQDITPKWVRWRKRYNCCLEVVLSWKMTLLSLMWVIFHKRRHEISKAPGQQTG